MMKFLRKKDPLDTGDESPDTQSETVPTSVMADSRWLKFFDLFKGLLTRSGVDYAQFRLIVGYKLYMDAVDPSFMSNLNNGRRRAGRNAFFSGLWAYGLVSLLMTAFIFAYKSNVFLGLGSMLLFYSLMYMTVLVQAFSGSLLDVRDVGILETRGVSEKTRSAAQTAHIMVYVLSLFLAMMALPIIASFIINGPLAGVLYLASALLIMLVNYVVSVGIYALVLHFFHGERLKNVLSMIQIGIMLFSVVLYQLPNIMTSVGSRTLDAPLQSFQWWMVLVYPFWFAGPNAWLQTGGFNPGGILSLMLAAAVIVSGLVYAPAMRRLTNNLGKLSESGEEPARTGWFFKLARCCVPASKNQRTFFTLSWRMMQSDSDYKMRVYPNMAFGFIFIIPAVSMAVTNARFEKLTVWQALQGSGWWNFLPAFSTIGIPMAVFFLRFSKNPNALKTFATIPDFDKSIFYREAVRTVFMRLAIPIIIATGIITMVFIGPLRGLGNTVLALGAGLLVTDMNGAFMAGVAPYGTVFQTGQVNTGVTIAGYLLATVVAGIAGGIGIFAPWWATLLLGAALLGGGWLILNHSYRNVSFVLPGEADTAQ
ncbi:hypothetical protein [Schleiferilactobacillus shenzhenensis]|uniref:Uncharacterized protein n=1 Tax=Schleiferilactobacillus shenzhenensis LY-73 TaxID=1231336 RepID=U4TXU5_9LACO|nr:hypothetical protein [Schleiferilactobacillus shenzhenensis]ERL66633.1 hypothetical protein L248_0312 [Schleiferilactobacillus shenzhenensis LY-73]